MVDTRLLTNPAFTAEGPLDAATYVDTVTYLVARFGGLSTLTVEDAKHIAEWATVRAQMAARPVDAA